MIFKSEIKRLDLLSLKTDKNNKRIKIAVYRNHSFEMIASVLNSFLDFSKLSAEFVYSDYDDSFTFDNKFDNIDLNIIWIDDKRYNNPNYKNWIIERLYALKAISNAKILVYHTGEFNFDDIEIPDVLIANLNKIKNKLENKTFDIEKQEYSGTRISNSALIEIAREIGLIHIPALLFVPIKAIIIDLDNTIYQGILGEDGINNLVCNYSLQKMLKEFATQGFLLAIVSKNEQEDVDELFNKRTDFPLKKEDFSIMEINWNKKSDNILNIAKKMNISTSDILFIDDNIGEIEEVKSLITDINVISAPNEKRTLDVLQYYPRLYKTQITNEDLIRNNDIKANQQRNLLKSTMNKEDYIKSLGIELLYEINPEHHKKRIVELLNKTNQFIFSYKRYNETEINEIFEDKNYCIITISMKDKLSDSGLIGIIVAHKEQNTIVTDELVISCRALGRSLEDIMISKALFLINKTFSLKKEIMIQYQKGTRNMPALIWLEKFSKQKLSNTGYIKIQPKKDKIDSIKIIVNN